MKTILWIILSCWVFTNNQANTIHVVAVGLTEDATLGVAVENNIDRLKYQIDKIANATGMTKKETYITGRAVNTEIILEAINQLQCKKEDVVIFHYSGHGYNQSTPWATFMIPGSKKITLQTIYQKLLQKQARLVLALADNCNSTFNKPIPEITTNKPFVNNAFAPKSGLATMQATNFQTLFKKGKGGIIATSSKKGYSSYYSKHFGGYFTLAFFDALNQVTKTRIDANWDEVLRTAKLKTQTIAESFNKEQEPFFKISDLPVKIAESEPEADLASKVRPLKNNEVAFDLNQPIRYKIGAGDNLVKIARRFGVSIANLKKWNSLEDDMISAGGILIIK